MPSSRAGSLVSGPAHGPLPILLLVMTAATGLVDAVSVLAVVRRPAPWQEGAAG